MAKADFSRFTEFASHKRTQEAKDLFVMHKDNINLGVRVIKGVVQVLNCKTPSEFADIALSTIETVTSPEKGNMFVVSHDDFIKRNKLVSFKLDLSLHFYISIIESFEKTTIQYNTYEKYVIYYVDGMMLTPVSVSSQVTDVRGKHQSNSYSESANMLMAKAEDIPKIQQLINCKLKEKTSKHLKAENEGNRYDGNISIQISPVDYPLIVKDPPFLKKIQKAYDLGLARSYLFYGPPGSGKTSLVSSIINQCGFRTFTINNLSGINITMIEKLFKVFEFDAVVIDDLDHQDNIGANALAALEFLKSKVKVVLATANIISGLNSALIRPGRIDEILFISHLEDEVVRKIIQPHGQLFEKLHLLPVAYIIEIMARIQINGLENIDKDIFEMQERAKNYLASYKNGSESNEEEE